MKVIKFQSFGARTGRSRNGKIKNDNDNKYDIYIIVITIDCVSSFLKLAHGLIGGHGFLVVQGLPAGCWRCPWIGK